MLPVVASIVRPVARTVVWGGLAIADGVSGMIAGVSEQVSDLIDEARAESAGGSGGSGAHRRPASAQR